MCSLGRHQEADDIRPARRRRHLDASARAALAEVPRETLADRRKNKHAELAADLGDAGAPLDDDQFQMNFEPLPPGTEQLPDCMIEDRKVPYWVDIA